MSNLVVVAGALISGASLLVAGRDRPAVLAGFWGLPGGKVAPGESDQGAVQRGRREDLGSDVTVGARLGDDVALSGSLVLRAYLVIQTGGVLAPHDHRALRWVGVDDIDDLPWVPADRAWVPDLTAQLGSGPAVS